MSCKSIVVSGKLLQATQAGEPSNPCWTCSRSKGSVTNTSVLYTNLCLRVHGHSFTGTRPGDYPMLYLHSFPNASFWLWTTCTQSAMSYILVCHGVLLILLYTELTSRLILDIKADNIIFEFSDQSALSNFEQGELKAPSPRKEVRGRCIYTSRELGMPKRIGAPILCDLESAVDGGVEHTEDVQPNIYRAPEVILEAPWTYSIDIWNVGCMVWDLFEGCSLFTGQDPDLQTYRSRAHLAEMISLLGPPQPHLVARGRRGPEFFPNGEFAPGTVLEASSLEDRETFLTAGEKADFLRFMRRMLQWEPEKRGTAKSLAHDEWIVRQLKR